MMLMTAGIALLPLTDKADDNRLNLWPLIGYDDGALDVIWPVSHFKSLDEWWIFPVFKHRDQFCVFPELWLGRNRFGILPLISTYDCKEGMIFPVVWWDFHRDVLHSIFPLYYYSRDNYHSTFWAGCGLGGWLKRDDEFKAHWFLPFYLRTRDSIYTIPYSRIGEDQYTEAYMFGLCGRSVNQKGGTEADWCAPLWYRDVDILLTLPFYCRTYGDELRSWFSLPILSGAWKKRDEWKERYLLGLGGRNVNERSGFRQSWLAPLWYEDSDGTLVTMLYGHTRDSSWVFPMWYTDERSLYTPFWCQRRNSRGEIDLWVAPPLLSSFGIEDDGTRKATALLGLAGANWGGSSEKRKSWLMPLYYEDDDGFQTLLYGYKRDGGYTRIWWATPLVGTYSDGKTGGWIFPLFNRKKDESFDRDLARLDAETIPEDIQFSTKVCVRTNYNVLVSCSTSTVASVNVDSKIRGSTFFFSDHDSSVRGRAHLSNGMYEIQHHSKQGDKLVFDRTYSRTVTYDIRSRDKVGEKLSSETFALGGLFWRKHAESSLENPCRKHGSKSMPHFISRVGTNTHTRVLWKLWDHEEKDGNVTIDAFPGLTYDSRTNGYSKTSFLWRFFRYEKDPEEGTKCDVLFIPVWR